MAPPCRGRLSSDQAARPYGAQRQQARPCQCGLQLGSVTSWKMSKCKCCVVHLPQRIDESDGGVSDPCARVRRVPADSSWTGPRGAHLGTHRRAIKAIWAHYLHRGAHTREAALHLKAHHCRMELGHAGAGEAWMPRYLGRTWADIASMLWEKDWNAIPELYDDSFGKHILIYPPACIVTAWTSALEPSPSSPRRRRASLPSGVSSNPSPSSSLSITDVRASTDCVGKSGAWNGFPVEVYRLHPRGYFALVQLTCASIALSRLFKYDEPHMIHPDCGEVTQFGTRSKGRTMRRRMGLAWRRPRYAGILRLKELRTRLKNAAGGSDEAKPRGQYRDQHRCTRCLACGLRLTLLVLRCRREPSAQVLHGCAHVGPSSAESAWSQGSRVTLGSRRVLRNIDWTIWTGTTTCNARMGTTGPGL